ncbi:class I SAM-dependent rRNA methyltransferase [Persephonella atlantica]|uniref:Class I SAM-dependent rRNA methyltransferase n=1 Tax=Persephonella atlantica TaxID=2699429 RepID=A0ABS1GJK6_9AQUI|nr:class I SAM-dependent rRNA methyltransferase [Persephonella atlantica]MBK3333015.1 class I SAM-dependent rRNA methyltransferase [Persephonella atlantica]
MKKVVLKKTAEKKIKQLNQWFYRNEIKKCPLDIQKGEIVQVFTSSGQFVGTGYFNPLSKISLRMLSFKKEKDISSLIKRRIEEAFHRRKKLLKNTTAFRAVHSEGDLLPGLIVDYYDGYLSVQVNTAGMENLRDTVIDTLIEQINPKGIYDRSDQKVRTIEGLETHNRLIYGEVPDSIVINENSIHFTVFLKEGQKTGFYLDQRKNRQIVSQYVEKGFRVLDLFSNAGGFGIYCYKRGADYVKFVDVSSSAVKQLKENCKLNSIENFDIVQEDAFDFLKKETQRYNIIIIDPPSFAKTKHEREGALRGFKYLLLKGLKLLEKDGYIAVFSCSFHITMEDIINVSLSAAQDTGDILEIVEFMYQDLDHPVVLNMPNTLYLKGILMRKL